MATWSRNGLHDMTAVIHALISFSTAEQYTMIPVITDIRVLAPRSMKKIPLDMRTRLNQSDWIVKKVFLLTNKTDWLG